MGVDGLHTEAGEEGGVVLGHEKAQGEAGGRLPEGEEGEGVKAGNPHPLPPPEEGGEAAARAVAARVQVFKRATSLGSVESLIEHRASVEGPDTLCPDDLLRLSIGIEPLADLLADLQQALQV